MTLYVATINTPGYLPMADEPACFDTAQEAWAYLADERTRAEDDTYNDGDDESYSDTRESLCVLGTAAHWNRTDLPGEHTAWLNTFGLAADGTGTVYGGTPGSDSQHDLGEAYSVSVVDPADRES